MKTSEIVRTAGFDGNHAGFDQFGSQELTFWSS